MSKATILLVDNDDFLETGTAFLHNHGYQVITAQNLREALRRLESQKIDLAIIDIAIVHTETEKEQFVVAMTQAFSAKLPKIILFDSPGNRVLRHILYYQSQDAPLETIRKTEGFFVLLTAIEELLKPPPADGDPAPKGGGFVFNAPVIAEQHVFVTRDPIESIEPRMHEGPPGGVLPAEVSFTAYHPREGKVETWHTLLVYTHLVSALYKVRRDANRFEQEFQTPKEITTTASTRIARGTDLTVVPSCEGIMFNPGHITFKWMEDLHRAEFRFKADQALSDDAAKGQISIFVGPLIVGSLKFAMIFDDSISQSALGHEERSEMYHKDAIFISYSHKDTEIVEAFKAVHHATGHNVLIDIDNLRSGQEWNLELMHLIDRADIFQLFWSANSCQSKYCQQEWQYALKRNKEGFIRPVFWKLPLPDPPQELSKYHFEYVEL